MQVSTSATELRKRLFFFVCRPCDIDQYGFRWPCCLKHRHQSRVLVPLPQSDLMLVGQSPSVQQAKGIPVQVTLQLSIGHCAECCLKVASQLCHLLVIHKRKFSKDISRFFSGQCGFPFSVCSGCMHFQEHALPAVFWHEPLRSAARI